LSSSLLLYLKSITTKSFSTEPHWTHSTLKNDEDVKGVEQGRCAVQRVDVQFGNLRVGQQQPAHGKEDLDQFLTLVSLWFWFIPNVPSSACYCRLIAAR
jgi:hypothetical protein